MHGRCPMTMLCLAGAQGELLARIQARRPANTFELYALTVHDALHPSPNTPTLLLPANRQDYETLIKAALRIRHLTGILDHCDRQNLPPDTFTNLLYAANHDPRSYLRPVEETHP